MGQTRQFGELRTTVGRWQTFRPVLDWAAWQHQGASRVFRQPIRSSVDKHVRFRKQRTYLQGYTAAASANSGLPWRRRVNALRATGLQAVRVEVHQRRM
jgi:hypothetical protein